MVTLARPARGRITNGFSSFHRAIDIGWGLGKSVYAAASGWVRLEYDDEYGLRIFIEHGDREETEYSHLAGRLVKDGQWVPSKFKIATMGNSGSFAKFVHLHFAHWVNGIRVMPIFGGISAPADSGTPIPIPILNEEYEMILTKVIDPAKGGKPAGPDNNKYFITYGGVSVEVSAAEMTALELVLDKEKKPVDKDTMFHVREIAKLIAAVEAARAPKASVDIAAIVKALVAALKFPTVDEITTAVFAKLKKLLP